LSQEIGRDSWGAEDMKTAMVSVLTTKMNVKEAAL
jgi:hypothetical protein